MTTSGVTPRATSAGSTSAAFAAEPDRPCAAFSRVQRATRASASSRLSVALVEIARGQPALDARRVDFDDERDRAVHRGGQRLRAAHAAESGGDDEPAARAIRRSVAAPRAASVS